MSTLTIRLPNDTHDRLKQLAAMRGMSLNKLMEELSIQTLSGFDAETRFRTLAAQADPQRALSILDRLDGQSETRP
jgi:plasmid stability protein